MTKVLSFKFMVNIILFFFNKFFIMIMKFYFKTAQNIHPEYRTSTHIKKCFLTISFSMNFLVLYFIFCHIFVVEGIHCQQHQRKKVRKIITQSEEIVGERNFCRIYFCDSVPQISCFVEGIFAIRINNC